MLAKSFGTFVAGLVDMYQVPTVRVAGNRLHRNGLARQRIRHIDGPFRSIGNAIPAMTEADNI